jgi:large subunit ribosomal protein L24
MKIKKGDNVIVIAGKNKGQTGLVTSVNKETNKVIVGGVNKVKKHIKAKTLLSYVLLLH